VAAIKRFQAARFRLCYTDLMESNDFGPAARFFLEELYSDADYSERDAQFARIAGTLATVFPASVVTTAVALAQVHALTEGLDHQMAAHCAQQPIAPEGIDSASYLAAWHAVGRRTDRQQQLVDVILLGRQLEVLTHKPGLALLLKLMRRPAESAGMGSLQRFLERGFAIFATLSRSKGKVEKFLATVESRELAWIETLFDKPPG
jgi:hypothetical protein